MKSHMNQKPRTWLLLLLLLILVVTAILATLWATSTFWFPLSPWEPRLPPPYGIPGDIEFFYTTKTVVSTVNVTLLVLLLLIYVSIYWKTRSEFTIGLIIFSTVLLLNVLSSNPIVTWAFGFRLFGLGPFALLPDLFIFAALVVLLYLSIK